MSTVLTLAPKLPWPDAKFGNPVSLVILAVAALVVAGIWLVALERVRHDQAITITDEIQKNSNLAQSQQERADRSFLVLDQILFFLRTEYASRGLPASLDARLASIQADRRYLSAVLIINAQGAVMSATSDSASVLNASHAERDYFVRHASDPSDQLLIGVPMPDKKAGSWAMTLTRRISAADGSFAGVALIALDPAYFATDYVKSMQGPRASMALLGLDGFIRARRTGDKLSFGEDNRTSQVYREILRTPNGSYIAVSPSDGTRRIVAYRSLERYPMIIAVGSSLEEALEPVRERERIYFGVAAASTLILVLVLGAILILMARRARVAAAIEESERQFRLLFENSLDAVISIRPDGRVMAANSAACSMFGREAAQLQSIEALQLFAADDPRMGMWRNLQAFPGNLRGQVAMVRSDGSRFEAEVSGSLNAGGSALHSMIIRDISERIRVENAVRDLNAELETRVAQRTAEIEAFMYSISHDLRAPLRAIDGYSAMLIEEMTLADKGDPGKYIERIRKGVQRMSDLLNDLLDLSRYSNQDLLKDKIDMAGEVKSIVGEMNLDTNTVKLEIGDLPGASGDWILIRQVWINLIENALKYSANQSPPVIGIGYANGAYFVRDNGVGFDEAYSDKLFKLFSRLHSDREFEGTGVGLAIVKRIIERHGGHIRAQAAVGKGATFSFTLPDGPAQKYKGQLTPRGAFVLVASIAEPSGTRGACDLPPVVHAS